MHAIQVAVLVLVLAYVVYVLQDTWREVFRPRWYSREVKRIRAHTLNNWGQE